MSKSRVAIGLVALVALALGLYFFVPATAPLKAQASTVDRGLAALLPAEATALMGIDVERLKGTPAYLYLEAESRQRGQDDLDEFAARTGFDPRRDVQRLLMAFWEVPVSGGTASAAPEGQPDWIVGIDQPRFLAVAQGNFDLARLDRQLVENGAEANPYRGLTVYHLPNRKRSASEGDADEDSEDADEPTAQRRGSLSLAFLDNRTVVLGSEAMVPQAIDRRVAGGRSVLDNSALVSRAEAVAGTNQLWAVSQRAGTLWKEGIPESVPPRQAQFLRILRSMENTSLALDLMQGVHLEAEGLFQSAADAKTLGDAARGFVALGRLSTAAENEAVLGLFDRIEITESDAALQVSIELEQMEFEKLMEALKEKRSERAGGERL